MRRQEFPLVTFVSLVVLALTTAWQVHRAMDFSHRQQSVKAVGDQPFSGEAIPRVELPELAREPKRVCITVFRPPTVQQRGRIHSTDLLLPPRPQFTLLRAGERDVDLQLNADGIQVKGLRLGGYFHFAGERFHLIDVKTNQVTLQKASNRLRFNAYARMGSGRRAEHHHL